MGLCLSFLVLEEICIMAKTVSQSERERVSTVSGRLKSNSPGEMSFAFQF